jgi:hypothetical protein
MTIRSMRRSATVARLCGGLIAVALALGACGDTENASQHQAPAQANTLLLGYRKLPEVKLNGYRTGGVIPHVVSGTARAKSVNLAIGRNIRSQQHAYVKDVRPQLAEGYTNPAGGPGIYETHVRPDLISASSTVVSALVPLTSLLPGGTDGSNWIAVTVSVATGRVVKLADLFERTDGMAALAARVRARILAKRGCVRASYHDYLGHQTAAEGFRPTASNYQYFALTPSGLTIGIPNGQVVSPGCGRLLATVPYGQLRPYLSAQGKALTAGVRAPRFAR